MPEIKLLRHNKKKPYKRDQDREAKRPQRQKVYGSKRYRVLKERKRQNNPICEICEMFGITEWAEHIHHWYTFVIDDPVESNRRAYDYFNLVSLCRKHHELLHTGFLKGCHCLYDVEERVKELGDDFKDIRYI